MKRLLSFLLILLFLTGCGAPSGSGTPAASAEPPAQEAATEQEESTISKEPAQEIITAESLKADYEAEGFIVREIIPYEGDFLVYYGTEPYNGIFQWVYTETGLRAPLLFSGREVLDYEILYPGHIRVLQGPDNLYNAAMSFPTYQFATTALPVWENEEIPTELYSSGSVEQQTYWAPISEGHVWGWNHGQVALVDLRITSRGIEAVFGPTADNIGGFFAAASSAPVADTDYDETTHTMTVTFRETVLNSGIRTEFTDEDDRNYYQQYQELYGLPTTFPTGTLENSNLFISRAELQQDGMDTKLILTLTDAAQEYTAEGGQLLKNESRPWMRLSFRDSE